MISAVGNFLNRPNLVGGTGPPVSLPGRSAATDNQFIGLSHPKTRHQSSREPLLCRGDDTATVLCVGGNENLHTRNLVLQSAGFDVTVATNVAAAVAALSTTSPQAVILDSSSTASPADLATELKHVRPTVPVLLVTDNTTDDFAAPEIDRTICRLDGPEALLRTVQELTSGVVAISGKGASRPAKHALNPETCADNW